MEKASVDYRLYLVTDRALAKGRSVLDVIERAVRGGATIVQLREKDLSTKAFVEDAMAAKALLEPLGVPLIVNDRIDVALAAVASGVHLGQDDMPCWLARKLLGPRALIGVSVGTPEQARIAEADGADYLGVSPVFDTPTKTDTPAAAGLDGLAAIRKATRLPLVGIGGIGAANAADVIAAGADGVAAVSAIVAADDPEHAAAGIRAAVDRAKGEP